MNKCRAISCFKDQNRLMTSQIAVTCNYFSILISFDDVLTASTLHKVFSFHLQTGHEPLLCVYVPILVSTRPSVLTHIAHDCTTPQMVLFNYRGFPLNQSSLCNFYLGWRLVDDLKNTENEQKSINSQTTQTT